MKAARRVAGDCIGEAETDVVVPVVGAVVVAIGATQVGWFVVPAATPENTVGASMPMAFYRCKGNLPERR